MFKLVSMPSLISIEQQREIAFQEIVKIYEGHDESYLVARKMKAFFQNRKMVDSGLDRVFGHAPDEDRNRAKACTYLMHPEQRDFGLPTRTYQMRGLKTSCAVLMDGKELNYVLGSKRLMASNFLTSNGKVANLLSKIEDHSNETYQGRYRCVPWIKTFDSAEDLTEAMKHQKLRGCSSRKKFFRTGEVLYRGLNSNHAKGILLDLKATQKDRAQAFAWQKELEQSLHRAVPIVSMLPDGQLIQFTNAVPDGYGGRLNGDTVSDTVSNPQFKILEENTSI